MGGVDIVSADLTELFAAQRRMISQCQQATVADRLCANYSEQQPPLFFGWNPGQLM